MHTQTFYVGRPNHSDKWYTSLKGMTAQKLLDAMRADNLVIEDPRDDSWFDNLVACGSLVMPRCFKQPLFIA